MQMEIFGTISVSERVYLMASALLAETPCLSVAQVLRVALMFAEVRAELELYRWMYTRAWGFHEEKTN